MAVNVERLLQRDLDRWAYLLGLGGWRITWDLLDEPISWDDPVAQNNYYVRKTGYRTAHIRFSRAALTSPAKIEKAVVHELLHLFDHGIGNDAHELIYRLEGALRRVRQRLSRR